MCIAYLGRGPPHSTLGCCGIRTQWGYCPIFLVIVVVWSVEQVRGLNVERAHCPRPTCSAHTWKPGIHGHRCQLSLSDE
ncbi:hypothetical protein OKW30_000006 [Paraburkholderia sp. Clong3]